ncbi:DUF2845 domain-containing protein, partial [Myxococcota bacterium]|nr:DUF2845 domain-containing protein [Myxococcota bacterium]
REAADEGPSRAVRGRGAVGAPTAVATVSNIEEWSYRSGGGELLRTLVFEDGRLVSIIVGGRAPVDVRRCVRQLFSRGTPATEVRLVCGEPVQEDRWIEVVEEEVREGVFVAKSHTRERWVYSFGPDTFLRIFELEDGRLVDQSTGGRGFATP